MAVLWINGVEMPTPKIGGITISKNKIWSKNTGRNNQGEMVGDIIAIKRKVEIEWGILSPEHMSKIDTQVSRVDLPYITVRYLDEKGSITEIRAYTGDISYPLQSNKYGGNNLRATGVKVSLIEK